jgi:hypothetical protein
MQNKRWLSNLSLLDFLLIGTTTISFFFFLWGVNSWQYSFVGDEWAFYDFAKNLIEQQYNLNPLSFLGVYGTHSVLASLYQAFFMRIFGINNFAWRLSNIVLIFPLSFFFYRWLKLFFSKEVAVLATLLMQCSFYLANFFKIGYDNPQSLTLFIICLYLAACFGKNPTKILGFWLGMTLGVSFYIYFGPAFPLFVWPYLLPFIKSLNKSQARKAGMVLMGTYILILFPLLFQLDYVVNVYHALGSSNSFQVKSTVFYDFLLFYRNNDNYYNHFVVGPYLDILSQIFCIIGSSIVILRFKKSPYLFFLLSYVTAVFFFGITSTDSSQTTRGIFLLPYGFTFAAIGLNIIRESIEGQVESFAFCWLIILVIATLNVYQSRFGVFIDKKAGYTGLALIIRSIQQAKNDHKKVLIVASDNINQKIGILPKMVQAYNITDAGYSIITPNQITCPASPSSIIFFQNDTEAQYYTSKLKCPPQITISMLSPTFF